VAILTIPAHWTENESLTDYTTWHLGGPAKYISQPSNLTELRSDILAAKEQALPVLAIGGGSNLLFPDNGFEGLVIRLPKVWNVPDSKSLLPADAPILAKFYQSTARSENEKIFHLPAGAYLAPAARNLAHEGFCGLEWAEGIPGTIGGAIINNAGAYGSSIEQCFARALMLKPNGDLACWEKGDLSFAYRSTNLKNKLPTEMIILAAAFRCTSSDQAVLTEKMREIKAQRESKIPREASCGCVFKNPPGDSAGRLIQSAGLGGLKIGGGEISTQHANFILNTSEASANDMLELIRTIRHRVYQHSKQTLQLEVQLAGFAPEVELEFNQDL